MGTDALDARRLNADRYYTGLSIGIAAGQNLIGDSILPVLYTDLSKESIVAFGTEAWRLLPQPEGDLVGDFSIPQRIDISMGKIDLTVDGHAMEMPISYRHNKESLSGPAQVDLDKRGLYVVKSRMALEREKRAALLVTAVGTYDVSHTADLNATSKQWDDPAVDPVNVIVQAVEVTIPDDAGSAELKKVLWMGGEVWSQVAQNPTVKNRIFGTIQKQGVPKTGDFASLVGVDEVVVGRAMSKTAAGVNTKFWGKNAGLVFVATTTGQEIPSFGYCVEQRVFGNATEAVVRIEDQHMGASGGYYLKRSHFYTHAITFKNAGFLWYNAVA